MNNHDNRHERSQGRQDTGPLEDAYDSEVSLRPFLTTTWLYRRVIAGAVVGIMTLFTVAVMVAYVIVPAERLGTVGFRLLFEGASESLYPNGTPFSSSEITSTPVLSEVFEANELDRFGIYADFQRSVFVLQSNPELDLLSFEYQTKLADGRLTPVDRASIEDEFRRRRDALSDPTFTLNLRQDVRITAMPRSLAAKVLDDTLATWARQATERKGVLLYDISVLSTNILRRDLIEREEFLPAVDILRTQVMRIMESIEEIGELPGAAAFRTGSGGMTLAEARTELEDILRFQLQPLSGMIRASGQTNNSGTASLYVNNQLFQIRLDSEEAQKRMKTVQDSLRAYMLRTGVVASEPTESGRGPALAGAVDQGLIPQLGESFLDRLVEMSTLNSDVEYRQQLTDRVIEESFAMAALEREQGYYQDSGSMISRGYAEGRSQEDLQSEITSRLDTAFSGVVTVVEQVTAIHEELSTHNLHPSTLLYSVTTPFTMNTERALAARTVTFYGILVLMLSLFVVPLGCLVHRYLLRGAVRQERGGSPVDGPAMT